VLLGERCDNRNQLLLAKVFLLWIFWDINSGGGLGKFVERSFHLKNINNHHLSLTLIAKGENLPLNELKARYVN